jgi:hypothetical protein
MSEILDEVELLKELQRKREERRRQRELERKKEEEEFEKRRQVCQTSDLKIFSFISFEQKRSKQLQSTKNKIKDRILYLF